MPSTYNGIGTHYYGKKNLQVRPGTCRQCNRSVNLSSYDTRLWFVVLFVPIIPIGRKRIIDACPACRRHYVTDLRKWETTKQLEISGALDKFRSDPTPDTAIAAHRQLLAFHQLSEAADLQKLMLEKFPDNARIYAYLGAAWTQFGRFSDADACFNRALALRPDMPEARMGAAEAHIRAGRLEEARKLLDFMEKPGAGQLYSLAPLEHLALAYQKMGRHQEALAIFKHLQIELPAISQHPGFRKTVKKSESALNQKSSILPKKKFTWRGLLGGARLAGAGGTPVSSRKALIILGAAAAVIVVAMLVSNELIRRHRRLYIANPFGRGLQVEISGIGLVPLGPGINHINLPEGHYVARISGPVQEQVDIDIHDTYFNRWSGKSVWLLNPGGAAILMLEHVVYRANPVPGSFNFVYGRSLQFFPHIDYPFEAMPHSISLPSGTTEATRTGLELFAHPPVGAFYSLQQQKRKSEATELAEWDLRRNPNDKDMIEAVETRLSSVAEIQRWDAFLRSGLTNRPVDIEWHRSYQELHLNHNDGVDLVGLYSSMVKEDPGNSALLYLRGRVSVDHAEATDYFKRSAQADSNNPYPEYAIAYDESSRGEWEQAEARLRRVIQLRPDDRTFRESWKSACIATAKYDEIAKSYESMLARDRLDWSAAFSLCDVLVARGDTNKAQEVISNVARAIGGRAPEMGETIRRAGMAHYLYEIGDFAGLEKVGRSSEDENEKMALFFALIEQGRLDEAGRIFTPDKVSNPGVWMACSLAWRMAGKNVLAEQWLAPALKGFHSGGKDSARAAALLESTTAPTAAAVDDLDMAGPIKPVLIANLAIMHPEARKELGAIARRLNVDRSFPYHLINRAVADAR